MSPQPPTPASPRRREVGQDDCMRSMSPGNGRPQTGTNAVPSVPSSVAGRFSKNVAGRLAELLEVALPENHPPRDVGDSNGLYYEREQRGQTGIREAYPALETHCTRASGPARFRFPTGVEYDAVDDGRAGLETGPHILSMSGEARSNRLACGWGLLGGGHPTEETDELATQRASDVTGNGAPTRVHTRAGMESIPGLPDNNGALAALAVAATVGL